MSKQEQSAPPTFSTEELGNFDLLVEGIFNVFSKKLGLSVPSIILYDEITNCLRIKKCKIPHSINEVVKDILGIDIYSVEYKLDYKKNVFVNSFVDKKIIVASSVEEMAYPFFSKRISKVFDLLLNVDIVVSLPIIVEEKAIGVFGFGLKGKQKLSNSEKDHLQYFANSLGAYINNLKDTLTKHDKKLKLQNNLLNEIKYSLADFVDEYSKNTANIKSITDIIRYIDSIDLITSQNEHSDIVE